MLVMWNLTQNPNNYNKYKNYKRKPYSPAAIAISSGVNFGKGTTKNAESAIVTGKQIKNTLDKFFSVFKILK